MAISSLVMARGFLIYPVRFLVRPGNKQQISYLTDLFKAEAGKENKNRKIEKDERDSSLRWFFSSFRLFYKDDLRSYFFCFSRKFRRYRLKFLSLGALGEYVKILLAYSPDALEIPPAAWKI